MKKILMIFLIILTILIIGLIGQSDYEEETIEVRHHQVVRLP